MIEISVNSTLYFDKLTENESTEDALERLQSTLNDNDIAAQFYKYETRRSEDT